MNDRKPTPALRGADAAARPLTLKYLALFSLPLALTFLMMAGAAPLVSTGISRMHGAEGERVHLSAFLMTFVTALMLYSTMFVARNVAIRTITCRRSMLRFAGFFLSYAAVCSGVILLVSLVEPVGHRYFGGLLGASPEVERLARRGMMVFTPIPFLVALRGLGQGCHISNGQSSYVGIGTALRLGMMALFVFGYAIHHNLSGPVLGGFTYLSGIATETVFVLLTLWNKPQWRGAGDGPVMTYRQFAHYALPLMLGSLFNQLMGPLLIYLIKHGRQPGENQAAFDLIRDTGWLMFSMLMTIMPAVITYANSPRNLRILLKFAGCLTALMTGVAMLMALTRVREVVFIDMLRLDNEIILQLTYTALLWMIPVPLVSIGTFFVTALHTRGDRTVWVTAGNLAGLLPLLLGTQVLDLSAYDGVIIAVIGNALYSVIVTAVQAIGLLNGGLAVAISPVSLAQQYHARGTPQDKPSPEGEPLPEHVRA